MNYPSWAKMILAVFGLCLPLVSSAAILYSQDVALAPGWNIVSTPKVLESHSFSAAETSNNFDIYVLDASQPSGWGTMAAVGQSEFTPLYGYFINNKTGISQTLTFNYKDGTSPSERVFNRTFPTPGWYSFGVANPENTWPLTHGPVQGNNPVRILSDILIPSPVFDLIIDFTQALAGSDVSSHAVEDPWGTASASEVENLNEFRETKGYAINITQADVDYGGYQNNVAPQAGPGIGVTFVSASAEKIFVADEVGEVDRGEFKIVVDITAFGDEAYIDKSNTIDSNRDGIGEPGGGFQWASTTDATSGFIVATTIIGSGTASGDTATTFKIWEGLTRRFTLTVLLDASVDGAGAVQLHGINWSNDQSDITPDNFYNSNMSEFKTDLLELLVQ